MKAIGNEGLYDIVEKLGYPYAEAKTVIRYAKSPDDIHYFEGSIKGRIIQPAGKSGFGWDPIFQPAGYFESFAELTREEKNKISMRRIALNKPGD